MLRRATHFFAALWAALAIPEYACTQEPTPAPPTETAIEATPSWNFANATTYDRPWYFSSEANVVKRRRMDERNIVVTPISRVSLFSTADFRTPYEPGVRLTLGRKLSPVSEVEVRNWWETGFHDYAAQTFVPGTAIQPFFNQNLYQPLPPIGSRPVLVEFDYKTQIVTADFWYRRWWLGGTDERYAVGTHVGPRMIFLQEQFRDYDNLSLRRGDTVGDTVYRTETANEMFGGGFGAMLQFRPSDNWSIWHEFNFGGFANFTTATNELSFQTGRQLFRASTLETRFSGDIEVALGAKWRARPWLEISFAYRAMYLWNMTSAPDVMSFNLLTQSKQNNELAFWIHGPTAGITISF